MSQRRNSGPPPVSGNLYAPGLPPKASAMLRRSTVPTQPMPPMASRTLVFGPGPPPMVRPAPTASIMPRPLPPTYGNSGFRTMSQITPSSTLQQAAAPHRPIFRKGSDYALSGKIARQSGPPLGKLPSQPVILPPKGSKTYFHQTSTTPQIRHLRSTEAENGRQTRISVEGAIADNSKSEGPGTMKNVQANDSQQDKDQKRKVREKRHRARKYKIATRRHSETSNRRRHYGLSTTSSSSSLSERRRRRRRRGRVFDTGRWGSWRPIKLCPFGWRCPTTYDPRSCAFENSISATNPKSRIAYHKCSLRTNDTLPVYFRPQKGFVEGPAAPTSLCILSTRKKPRRLNKKDLLRLLRDYIVNQHCNVQHLNVAITDLKKAFPGPVKARLTRAEALQAYRRNAAQTKRALAQQQPTVESPIGIHNSLDRHRQYYHGSDKPTAEQNPLSLPMSLEPLFSLLATSSQSSSTSESFDNLSKRRDTDTDTFSSEPPISWGKTDPSLEREHNEISNAERRQSIPTDFAAKEKTGEENNAPPIKALELPRDLQRVLLDLPQPSANYSKTSTFVVQSDEEGNLVSKELEVVFAENQTLHDLCHALEKQILALSTELEHLVEREAVVETLRGDLSRMKKEKTTMQREKKELASQLTSEQEIKHELQKRILEQTATIQSLTREYERLQIPHKPSNQQTSSPLLRRKDSIQKSQPKVAGIAAVNSMGGATIEEKRQAELDALIETNIRKQNEERGTDLTELRMRHQDANRQIDSIITATAIVAGEVQNRINSLVQFGEGSYGPISAAVENSHPRETESAETAVRAYHDKILQAVKLLETSVTSTPTATTQKRDAHPSEIALRQEEQPRGADLEQELAKYKVENAGLAQQASRAQQVELELIKLRNDLAASESRAAAAELRNEQLTRDISLQMEKTKTHLNGLSAEREQMRQHAAQLTDENRRLSNDLVDVRHQLDVADMKIAELAPENRDKYIDLLATRAKSSDAQINVLSAQIRALEQQSHAAQAIRNDLKEEIEAAHARVSELEKIADSLNDQLLQQREIMSKEREERLNSEKVYHTTRLRNQFVEKELARHVEMLEERKQRIEEIMANREKFKTALSSATQRCHELEMQLEAAETRILNEQSISARLSESLEREKENRGALEIDIANLKTALTEANEKCERGDIILTRRAQELQEVTDRLAAKSASQREAEKKALELERQLRDMEFEQENIKHSLHSATEEKLAEHRHETVYKERAEALELELTEAKQELEVLRVDLRDLERTNAALQTRSGTLDERITKYTADLLQAESRSGELIIQVDELKREITRLTRQIAAKENEMKAVLAELADRKQSIDSVKTDIQRSQEDLSNALASKDRSLREAQTELIEREQRWTASYAAAQKMNELLRLDLARLQGQSAVVQPRFSPASSSPLRQKTASSIGDSENHFDAKRYSPAAGKAGSLTPRDSVSNRFSDSPPMILQEGSTYRSPSITAQREQRPVPKVAYRDSSTPKKHFISGNQTVKAQRNMHPKISRAVPVRSWSNDTSVSRVTGTETHPKRQQVLDYNSERSRRSGLNNQITTRSSAGPSHWDFNPPSDGVYREPFADYAGTPRNTSPRKFAIRGKLRLGGKSTEQFRHQANGHTPESNEDLSLYIDQAFCEPFN